VSRLSDLPVIITGESGTGKELVARGLHALDPRRSKYPYVALNCAAIASELLESELFGHRRGAFTGAERDRPGLVRAAHGGVLFLDEVAELSLPHQVKLLRVLQTQRVLGVGEDVEVPVDVRIVVATNRDVAAMVQAGTFREDLYHRLAVVPLHVPPLRERVEDLAPLVDHFLHKHHALSPRRVVAGADFVSALSRTRLPGNVRELENLICRALTAREDAAPLGLADLPRALLLEVTQRQEPAPGPSRVPIAAALEGGTLADEMRRHERAVVESAVRLTGGNQARAARLLGITPRSVYNKIRKYGITA
jgi:transcriptional regulator with GAF, ATPase, and Fis domain